MASEVTLTPESGRVKLSPQMIRQAVLHAMKERGWSLFNLSEHSGVHYSRLHDWLSDNGIGKRGPSIENLDKIFKSLSLSICSRKKRKRK